MRGAALQKSWGRKSAEFYWRSVSPLLLPSLQSASEKYLSICCSPKGSTDNSLTLSWIKFFDEQTREKANGRYRRLFLDGHKSHCSLLFIRYARLNKIVVVCYPPHTTHALQGLDVVIFAHVKTHWSKKLQQLHLIGEKITKENFIQSYATVREAALSTSNVLAAWKATGIWPFNRGVIEPEQLAPAKMSSTETTAPAKLPRELEDVREALRLRRLCLTESSSKQTGLSEPSTPNRVSNHIAFAVRGTEYEYISNPALSTFSSNTPPPELIMSPVHHHHPTHYAYLPKSADIESLSPEDARHYLKLANQHLAYQSDKIDRLETQLLCVHQYSNAVHQKLHGKENRKEKSGTAKLAAKGNRAMTSDEWEACLEKEESDRVTKETLVEEYNAWKEADRAERKASDDDAIREWTTYRDGFLSKHPKRKRCDRSKPAPIKRPDTPERFWSIRPKRCTLVETFELEGMSSGGEEEEENG